MKNLAYKKFSRQRHEGNIRRGTPSVCQFELTFGCGLHCAHCYTDCYNNPRDIHGELKAKQVEKILDKLAGEGILWLCLTGGDPLSRPDFSEIYRAAHQKGFLVTLFTSAFHVTDEIVALLRQMPPFAIEVTMNAAHRDVFDRVVRRKGAFDRVSRGIRALKEAGLPLKLKMQVTRQTVAEFPGVKRFAARAGLVLEETAVLYPRLNGDAGPCRLRLAQETLAGRDLPFDSCHRQTSDDRASSTRPRTLFPCAIESADGIFVDPRGRVFLCPLIRDVSVDLTKVRLVDALGRLSVIYRGRTFQTDSLCRDCSLAGYCSWCPGKAFLETKDMEAPIPYYCRLTQLTQR